MPNCSHKEYNQSLSVAGNGKSLGFTNGVNNFGIRNTSNALAMNSKTAYNVPAGTIVTNSPITTDLIAYGITTDATKSGLVGNLTYSLQIKMIIKY